MQPSDPIKIVKLRRLRRAGAGVLGRLEWEAGECRTLEHPERHPKITGHTGIPAGGYDMALRYSGKYRRPMPYVEGVSGFSGIMLHPGNTLRDTRGCILLGETATAAPPALADSRSAFERFYGWFAANIRQGEHIVLNVYPPGGIRAAP